MSGSASALADPLAKCLSSIQVDVTAGADGACLVTLTPLAGQQAVISGLWGGDAAATYTELVPCPTAAGAPVTAAGDDAGVADAILAAVNSAIYGTPVASASADSIDWATDGKALVSRTAGSVTLEFAVTAVSSPAHLHTRL